MPAGATASRKWTVQLFDGPVGKDNPPVVNESNLTLAEAQAEFGNLLKVGDRLATQPLVIAFIPPAQEQPASPLAAS